MPSLREKKRYIAFKVVSNQEIKSGDAKKGIEATMRCFLGDLGMAKVGILFLKDWKNNTGIMRVNTKYVDEAKAGLALVQKINEKKVIVKSVHVSGMIDKVRNSCF